MIDVIVYDDGLPISVIIPTTKDKLRKDFFENYVFPLIDANRPMEIIINDDLGGAPKTMVLKNPHNHLCFFVIMTFFYLKIILKNY
jgi:hypothetical protein